MKAVILVPRRADHGHRDRVWAWVRAWWERELKLPIFEGHHDEGLFNRSAACNRAAAAAGDWDVAVLIDADVVCDPDKVREAITIAHRDLDHLVLPFTRRHNLTRQGSERIMAGETGSWRSFIGITYAQQCSAVVVIPRKVWDTIGGFDERFVGWGFEDNAFACAAETFGRSLEQIEGEVWHLWHPTAKEGRRHSPSYRANRARHELYATALGDPDAVRALQAGDPNPVVEIRERENIPRILHRTVPVETSAEVEGWWAAFEKLHPGWTLLTHRDPLDPAEWPLTARAWGQCTSGAQLAGLIRLEALYRWGGIYVDSDVQPYRSLEPLLSLRAFAAWEDDKVVPDAVVGAEPEHPAIKACLDLALRRIRKGAWASGPGVTTQVLPRRSDVLLLPPGSFYPVHYRDPERDRKMPSWQSEPWTFALHHYHGSWLDAPADGERATGKQAEPAMTRQPETSAGLSFLIPFRDADGSRTPAKDWIIARWRHFYPDAEFIFGTDDGTDPFNKSAAVNEAARHATGDLFVILDADTWVEPESMRKAIDLIHSGTAPWVIPARRSFRLTRGFSNSLLAMDPTGSIPEVVRRRSIVEVAGWVVGFCHVLPRAAFEKVGGMDERFRGWGGEDSCFVKSLDVVVGRHMNLSGALISLWHERPRADRHRIWRGQTREHDALRTELASRYARARTRDQMLALVQERAA